MKKLLYLLVIVLLFLNPVNVSAVKIWDSKINTPNTYGNALTPWTNSLIWENYNNWYQVPYGTTSYSFQGDPVVEITNGYYVFQSEDWDSPYFMPKFSKAYTSWGMSGWEVYNNIQDYGNESTDYNSNIMMNMHFNSFTIYQNTPSQAIVKYDGAYYGNIAIPGVNVVNYTFTNNSSTLTPYTPNAFKDYTYGISLHFSAEGFAVAVSDDLSGNDIIYYPLLDSVTSSGIPTFGYGKTINIPSTNDKFVLELLNLQAYGGTDPAFYAMGFLQNKDPSLTQSQIDVSFHRDANYGGECAQYLSYGHCWGSIEGLSVGTNQINYNNSASRVSIMSYNNTFMYTLPNSASASYSGHFNILTPGSYRVTGKYRTGSDTFTYRTVTTTDGDYTLTNPGGLTLVAIVGYLFDRTGSTPANVYTPMDIYNQSWTSSGVEYSNITITTNPNNQSIYVSQNATFSSSASGSGTITYQWQKNGTNISGATNSSYTTELMLNTSNNGSKYRMCAYNVNTSACSTNATLLVYNAISPYILVHPQNVTSYVGYSTTFTIDVNGTSPFTYQWMKNGTNISGANFSSYTTPSLNLSLNNSKYSVFISNIIGNVTSINATLTIHEYPPINLINNPGFESGTDSWSLHSVGGAYSLYTSGINSPEGSQNGQVEIHLPSTNAQMWQDGISLNASQQYRFSVWGKSQNNQSVLIQFINASPFVNHGFDHTCDFTNVWSLCTYDFNTTSALNDIRFRVWLADGTIVSDTYSFDYFSLYPYNSTPANTAPSISGVVEGSRQHTSMTINFTTNQSNANSVIRYSQFANMTSYSLSNPIDSGLNRNHTISGLLSGTTYYYSVYIYNSTEEQQYSNSSIQNFTTWFNITDSYNISISYNATQYWVNGSTTQFIDVAYDNTTDANISITVYSYNNSGTGSLSSGVTYTLDVPVEPETYDPGSLVATYYGGSAFDQEYMNINGYDYLAVGDGGQIKIYNISAIPNLATMSYGDWFTQPSINIPIRSLVRGMEYSTPYLHVVGQRNYSIIDMTDPDSAYEIGNFSNNKTTNYEWMDIAVNGNATYIAGMWWGTLIFNTTNKSSPSLSAIKTTSYTVDSPDRPQRVIFRNNTLYEGLYYYDTTIIFNATDPYNLVALTNISSGVGTSVYVSGLETSDDDKHLYVVEWRENLKTYNISNKSNPILESTLSSTDVCDGGLHGATDVVRNGSTLYLGARYCGLSTWSLANKSLPAKIAENTSSLGYTERVTIMKNYTVVSSLSLGYTIYNSSVTPITRIPILGEAYSFEYNNYTLFVGGRNDYITALGVSNITNIELLSQINSRDLHAGSARWSGLTYDNGLLYSIPIWNYGLDIINVTNTSNMVLKGSPSVARPGNPDFDPIIDGNYLYVAIYINASSQYQLAVYDISDKTNPSFVEFFCPLGCSTPMGQILLTKKYNDTVFVVSSSSGLFFIGHSTPGTLSLITQYPGNYQGMEPDNTTSTVYAFNYDTYNLTSLNTANLAGITVRDNLSLSGVTNIKDMEINNATLYSIATYAMGFFNISDPNNLEYYSVNTDVHGEIITIGNYIYTGDDMAIYAVMPYDIETTYSPPEAGPAPNITSWTNTYTSNATFTLSVVNNSDVSFSAIANQTVSWHWALNCDDQETSTVDSINHIFNYFESSSCGLQVYVSNENGSSSTLSWNITILPSAIPDTNTIPALTSVTNQTCLAHSCVISFNVNQTNAITRIRYGLTGSLGLVTSNQTTGLNRTDNLSSLNNNTLYYYTVDAWNSSNNSLSTNSSLQSFTTPEDYVAPTPTPTPTPTSTPALPALTILRWNNSYTFDSVQSFGVSVDTLVYFGVEFSENMTNCYWTGVDSVVNCSNISVAYKTFNVSNNTIVSVYGTNANGSTRTLNWFVRVGSGVTTPSHLHAVVQKQSPGLTWLATPIAMYSVYYLRLHRKKRRSNQKI